jgi:hypothetical protein
LDRVGGGYESERLRSLKRLRKGVLGRSDELGKDAIEMVKLMRVSVR